MDDILRGLKIVLVVAAAMAVLSGLVTVIVAGVGLVLSVICRLVPILLAAVFVVGVLWLIGRIARALGRK